jgi:competence protein ComEC
MLTAMLVFVLTACRIPRTHWILFLAPLLIAYTAATGMSSSAVRACIMAIAFFAAPLLGREGDALSALSLAAISILIVRPDQLFDPGFLLSFSAVLGLICLYPPFQSYATRRVGPDPLRVQPEPRYATLMRHAFLYVWALAVASAAASLVTTPIVAYFFGIVPLIGLVGNLVAVPLAFLIVCTACLSLFLGSLIPALGEVFNHANWLLVSMLTRTINLLADVPGSHFAVRLPSGWLVLPWYVGLAALVAKLSVDATRRSAYSSVSAETRPGAETDPSSPG